MFKLKTRLLIPTFMFALLFLGCSHTVERASIDKTEGPSAALNDNLTKVITATSLQADVLAPENYEEGRELYNEAREIYSEQDFDTEDFYEKVAFSTAYLDRAIQLSEKRRAKIAPIAKARLSAITAGAKQFPATTHQLKEVDSDLTDFAENFENELNVQEFSKFQKRYQEVEANVIEERYLGKAYSMMEQMEKKDMESRAPIWFERTWKDLNAAKNLIKRNPGEESEFVAATNKANESVLFLNDIMKEMEKRMESMSETVAADLVRKNRKIVGQQSNLAQMHTHLDQAHSLIDGMSHDLANQTAKLDSAQEKVAFQKMMESVQAKFDENEAEVYQAGSKLIIRLKNVRFPVNEHTIPNSAKPLLDRVATTVESMDPSKVEIVGHTDSTGPKPFNEYLSKKRAKSVATYLKKQDLDTKIESSGAASDDPISANKSRKGREMNRRVDVIVTASLN